MRIALATILSLLAAPAFAQEKHVSSDASVRTILGFTAPVAAIQKLLPDGWELDPPSSGPSNGVNLRVTFADAIWVENAEGKPGIAGRSATIGVPVKNKSAETRGNMQIAGLTGAAPGPYGVYARATSTVRRAAHIGPDGVAAVDESWDFKGETDSIQLLLQYVRGTTNRSKIDIKIYSSIKPEFYRIYRYTQAADVVRGASIGSERVKSVTFKASGSKLAPLFDGTEQLISITMLPYYSRQIFLPGS